jgi:hypothetical protein
MTQKHERLVEKALETIDEIFHDRTVGQFDTQQTLEYLIEEIQTRIDTLDPRK